MNGFIGNIYAIDAKNSGKSLAVDHIREDNDARIVQYEYSASSKDNHRFMIIPQNNTYNWIVALHSGKGMAVYGISHENDTPIVQFDCLEQDNALFKFKKVDGDYCWILAKHSNKAFAVYYASNNNDAPIVQWDAVNQPNELFRFRKVGTHMVPKLDLRQKEPGDIDFPPELRLKNLYDKPPTNSNPCLIGETLVPFFFVNDGLMSRKAQVQSTPYYRFRREQFWRNAGSYNYPGSPDETRTFERKMGMSKTTMDEVERTMSYSVKADAGFSFWGINSTLSASFQETLRWKHSEETKQMEETTTTIEKKFVAGHPSAYAYWQLMDRFTLYRTDGTVALTFEYPVPNVDFEDAFPMSTS